MAEGVLSDENAIQQAARLLLSARHPVALTGAGISTPSGVPDFRSHGGLWDTVDPFEVASLSAFRHHPERFFAWFRSLAARLLDAEPNPAHYALAQLENLGLLRSVITQNIDNLHIRAGSQTVHEVHGHLRELVCLSSFRRFPAQPRLAQFLADPQQKALYSEETGGLLKPTVVLFGEQLPVQVLNAAQRDVRHCDLLLIVGSSLEVYPVADLPRLALKQGAKLIIINYEKTQYDAAATLIFHDNVATVLPQIVTAVEAKINVERANHE